MMGGASQNLERFQKQFKIGVFVGFKYSSIKHTLVREILMTCASHAYMQSHPPPHLPPTNRLLLSWKKHWKHILGASECVL